MISVSHLTKYYGSLMAVDDLSFEIDEGHVYGFLGPNGAGKTTTMNIMTDCLSGVMTMQITYAARNSDFDGFDIHEGDYLALLDGKLLGTDRDVSALLDGLSDEAASREAEFITVFYGEDVNEEDAHKACDAFTRKCPDAEVNLICGGQPVYYYIISIE